MRRHVNSGASNNMPKGGRAQTWALCWAMFFLSALVVTVTLAVVLIPMQSEEQHTQDSQTHSMRH
jgi:Na+/H+ antiporter NhaD/arsenite permease-like protein